jgi:hypothetical protein
MQKIDLNNQIQPGTIQDLLDNIDPDQQVDSDVLADALNGLIYNNEVFDGSELDVDALAGALFGEFEEKPVDRQLEPE